MKSYTAFLDEAISARRLKELEAKGKAGAVAAKMAADKLDRERATSTSEVSDQKKLQGQVNRQQQSTDNKQLPTSTLAIRKKPEAQRPVGNETSANTRKPEAQKPSSSDSQKQLPGDKGSAIVKTGTEKTTSIEDEKQAGQRPKDGRPSKTKPAKETGVKDGRPSKTKPAKEMRVKVKNPCDNPTNPVMKRICKPNLKANVGYAKKDNSGELKGLKSSNVPLSATTPTKG